MLRRYAVFLVVLGAFAICSAPASAEPGWQLTGRTYPTNIAPGSTALITINLYNVGATSSNGAITVTDVLPAGLTASDAGELIVQSGIQHNQWTCTGATVVTCVNNPGGLPSIEPGDAESDRALEQIGIEVKADPGLSETTLTNHITMAGGGALASASTVEPIAISSTPAKFGFVGYDGWFSNADGTTDTQAGSHPYSVTVSFDLASVMAETAPVLPGKEARDLEFKLPAGLVGDPNAVPQCTNQQLLEEICPVASQIGVNTTALSGFLVHPGNLALPVYNMVPPPGIPAQFAFLLYGVATFLDADVRSDGDYGITEHINNINQSGVIANTITIWGVPADPSHDVQRESGVSTGCGNAVNGCTSGAPRKPFLTLPTSCVGPQTFLAHVDTWEDPNLFSVDSFLTHDANGVLTGFTGCDRLSMRPSIGVSPDTSQADTPAGLTVDVRVPQEGLSALNGLSAADIKNTTVTLPEGLVVNPGQAAGLAACQAPESGVGSKGPPSCPAASKVGTVAIATPLLSDKLEGDVYVLQSNPPNLKLLVAASGEGVNLKLVGDVHLDEATGRLTTTFKETPQLPFTDFKLSFNGGAQAALATPTHCGTYTTTSDFTPWSTPFSPDAFPEDSFVISSGPGGGPCPSASLPFSPSMIAGSTTDQASGFTNFSLLLRRDDGQQRIEKLQFKAPEGLSGMISKVPLCGEPQAAQGTCPESTQIGHTVVTAGPGPYPLVVPQPGKPPAPIYLTGPYKGAPFGLSIVTPVIAGPFDLGTVITRAKIEIDPVTAQITVTTDPLPQIIDGVPTDLRAINAVIDREGFMFNPSSCEPREFGGSATSAEGTTVPISSHFQVGSCQALKFAPRFAVSTSGKTSKANGTSLNVRLAFPNTPQGSQANIHLVKVELPKQLPSRLTTLQKACTAAQFNTNPAGCPAASVVGHARAITPVLPVPLEGPAYFVSHGGEAFPSLIMVLQGYGVRIDLVGTTFISKAGITSSTFKTVPDQPVSSFELTLPQGPYSALTANGNLCTSKLRMPTEFIGQNGTVIHQSTSIGVTGCPKTKALTRSQKLAKALKACHKKPKAKRSACERQARKHYGRAVKAKSKKK